MATGCSVPVQLDNILLQLGHRLNPVVTGAPRLGYVSLTVGLLALVTLGTVRVDGRTLLADGGTPPDL